MDLDQAVARKSVVSESSLRRDNSALVKRKPSSTHSDDDEKTKVIKAAAAFNSGQISASKNSTAQLLSKQARVIWRRCAADGRNGENKKDTNEEKRCAAAVKRMMSYAVDVAIATKYISRLKG